MNPNREGPQFNFEMPPPAPESGEAVEQDRGKEAPAARPETVGNQPAQPVLPTVPDDIPVADQPVIAVPPQDDQALAAATDNQHQAADTDRIESVWVEKAKSIIAKTHDDPHLQKQEMSRIKADYIQKRFGKQIKTDETGAWVY